MFDSKNANKIAVVWHTLCVCCVLQLKILECSTDITMVFKLKYSSIQQEYYGGMT